MIVGDGPDRPPLEARSARQGTPRRRPPPTRERHDVLAPARRRRCLRAGEPVRGPPSLRPGGHGGRAPGRRVACRRRPRAGRRRRDGPAGRPRRSEVARRRTGAADRRSGASAPPRGGRLARAEERFDLEPFRRAHLELYSRELATRRLPALYAVTAAAIHPTERRAYRGRRRASRESPAVRRAGRSDADVARDGLYRASYIRARTRPRRGTRLRRRVHVREPRRARKGTKTRELRARGAPPGLALNR